MKKLLWLYVLCGCATVPMARRDLNDTARDEAPPPDSAYVYVFRPSSVLGVAIKLQVVFDEQWVGELASATFVRIAARPGEHQLVVRANGDAAQTLVLDAGRSYFVKAVPRWGDGGAHPSAEIVTDERVARAEVRSCGLVAGAAAETIRRMATDAAELTIAPVGRDALVAAATRAVDAMRANAGTAAPPDLDLTIARLRMTRPGVTDAQILSVAVHEMEQVLDGGRAKGAASDHVVDRSTGLVVRAQGHDAVVASTLPGSPAALAGIEPGATLREIDGHPTRDQAPPAVRQLLAGAPGSELTVVVATGGGEDRKLVLRRAPGGAEPVDCRILDGRILYLRPWAIEPGATRRIRDLARAAGPAARLAILDLRDATGGSLAGGRELADSFLAGGTIMAVAGARVAGIDVTYSAAPDTSPLEAYRVAVLVSGRTSGMAEVAAAALQDNRRAAVLGSTTAGRVPLTVVRRTSGVGIAVPIARLLRPTGQPLDGRGVVPDVDVAGNGSAPIPSEAGCPGVVAPASVAHDPVVGLAAALLDAPPSR